MVIDDKSKNASPSASIAQQVQSAGREVRARAAGLPTGGTSFSGPIKPAVAATNNPGVLTKANATPASPPALSQIRKPPSPSGQAPAITPGKPSVGPRDQGGGPGLESPGSSLTRSNLDSKSPVKTPGVGTPTVTIIGDGPATWTRGGVDMTPDEVSAYFKPSKQHSMQGAAPGASRDGVYLPRGGYGTGGMVNAGQPEVGTLFSGRPTMLPAQQQATQGQDIFGDTAALLERRAQLQSQMDAHYAKNPIQGNDLMAIFNNIAAMGGQRKEMKEIGERRAKRDELVAQLHGISMQGKNALDTQGLQNKGQLEAQGLQNKGQLDIQNMVGDQLKNRTGMEIFGSLAGIRQQGKNAMDVQRAGDSAAMDRTKLTADSQENIAVAGQKPYDYESNQVKAGEAILKLLTDPEASLTKEQRAVFEETGMGMLLSGTGMEKPRVPKKR